MLFKTWKSTVDYIKCTSQTSQDPTACVCSDSTLSNILAFLHALCDIDKAFTLFHDSHIYLFTIYALAYAAQELDLRSLTQAIFHTDK